MVDSGDSKEGIFVPLLTLSCANCSAPLEVAADLERFTCSYCGTAQIVERSGGVVSTRKLEAAISAVQRGTDRTAAELAMPRLNRELDELMEQRAQVVHRLQQRLEQAKTGRHTLVIIATFSVAILWAIFVSPITPTSTLGNIVKIVLFWVVVIGTSTLVYRKTKLPKFDLVQETEHLDEKIDKIRAHIKANRRILDTLPT
ncbi:hypothetical protein [Acidovorax sp. A1169]|uniref:hypothetical protein n=1 Tax=Acidovorax sp. A1169 TaxID=3059524 RepID=UPI002737B0D0|nr:hypothetical protein [Acidovorax sp. A1169]MDP4074451.1 hypothetical protein [Acidovorax sp. A1169]